MKKEKMLFCEKQNINSERESATFKATSLTAAKRRASALQAFYGTVIVIETPWGDYYKEDGKWEEIL